MSVKMEVLEILGIIVIVLVVLYFLMIMPRILHKPDTSYFYNWRYAHRGLHDNQSEARKLPGGIPEGSGGRLWNRTGYPVVKRQDSCGFS